MGARDCWVGVAIDGDGYRDQNWRGRWSYWGFLLKYGEGKVSEEVERKRSGFGIWVKRSWEW